MMRIYVDADGCPSIPLIEQTVGRFGVPVTLVCDEHHLLTSDTSEIITVSSGRDAADFALINRCQKGDGVITQDYGVAAMALGKGAFALHPSGKRYTKDNIDQMLMERHLNNRARKNSNRHHLKGPKKRTTEDIAHFINSLEKMLQDIFA